MHYTVMCYTIEYDWSMHYTVMCYTIEYGLEYALCSNVLYYRVWTGVCTIQ